VIDFIESLPEDLVEIWKQKIAPAFLDIEGKFRLAEIKLY